MSIRNTNFISPEYAYEIISTHWHEWININNFKSKKWVIAISGGKDSTIVAALAAKLFGKENVIGVTLPCDEQKDINDSMRVINAYCGQHININIGDMFHSILNGLDVNCLEASNDTKINIPPRLRMTVTYAVAQTVNGIVLNTSNLTEDILGYCTLWGDTTGSYAPLQGLTVTEVLSLGKWLGIDEDLVYKVPADGLQGQTDEERLGMKYYEVDNIIRGNYTDIVLMHNIYTRYRANKFKLDMIKLPGPKFEFLTNSIVEI
jgi:NAD+ synthase